MLKHVTLFGASILSFAISTQTFAQDANTVVATVGDVEITLGEMIIARAQLPQQYEQFPAEIIFNGILDQLIQQQLLSNLLEDEPDRLRLSLINERRTLRAGEVISTLSESVVTDEAVQAAYDAAYSDQEPQSEYNASHILVETEEEALAARARVVGGEAFPEVARELSTGPSGPNGGTLGWFGAGQMVPAFEATVMELSVGEVSEPVQTQFGWHIVILDDLRETPPVGIDAVRNELTNGIREAAIQAKLTELESEYEVVKPAEDAFDPALLNNLDLLEP
jgi:peptidyl-prolyl cis-trans isomerase C